MNGDTPIDFGDRPIDCYLPQFSQREASDLARVEMATINNWLHSGSYKLAIPDDPRLRGRRFFSIADIAALHTMDVCVRNIDMRPAAATVAGRIVFLAFRDRRVFGEKAEDGRVFEYWHIMRKPPHPSFDDMDGWSVQGVRQDQKTGGFFHYDPIACPDEEPFGLPHFPCLSIPTSNLVRRIFLKCADHLQSEDGDGGK